MVESIRHGEAMNRTLLRRLGISLFVLLVGLGGAKAADEWRCWCRMRVMTT
jgi:hypothetical protein